MSSNKKGPFDGSVVDELDDWDKMFDSLHEEDDPSMSDVPAHGAAQVVEKAAGRKDGSFLLADGGSGDGEGIESARPPLNLSDLSANPVELDDEPDSAEVEADDQSATAEVEVKPDPYAGRVTLADEPGPGEVTIADVISPLADDPFELGPTATGAATFERPSEPTEVGLGFELGAAGSTSERSDRPSSVAFELGAPGATPQSAREAAAEFFGETLDEEPIVPSSTPVPERRHTLAGLPETPVPGPTPPKPAAPIVEDGLSPALKPQALIVEDIEDSSDGLDEPTPQQFVVDEDFYDDIEVSQEEPEDLPMEPARVERRPTVNVVRRVPTTQSPPVRPVQVRMPTLEVEDAESFDLGPDEATKVVALSPDQLAKIRSRPQVAPVRPRDSPEGMDDVSDLLDAAGPAPTVDMPESELEQNLADAELIPGRAEVDLQAGDDVPAVFAPTEDDIDNAIDDLFSFGDEQTGNHVPVLVSDLEQGRSLGLDEDALEAARQAVDDAPELLLKRKVPEPDLPPSRDDAPAPAREPVAFPDEPSSPEIELVDAPPPPLGEYSDEPGGDYDHAVFDFGDDAGGVLELEADEPPSVGDALASLEVEGGNAPALSVHGEILASGELNEALQPDVVASTPPPALNQIVAELSDETLDAETFDAETLDAETLDAESNRSNVGDITEAIDLSSRPVGDETVADLISPPDELGEFEDDELADLHTGVHVISLDDADVAPELPESLFPVELPALDLDRLAIAPIVGPDLEDRTEAAARDLIIYERELELIDEPGPAARISLEAARLAMQVGDYDRALTHYSTAVDLDGSNVVGIRGQRRVAQALGDWDEVLAKIEAEVPLASPMERRALAAYRADLLAALGDRDGATAAVAKLLEEAPTDTRALLLRLELAVVEDDRKTVGETLATLAQYLGDSGLSDSIQLARLAGIASAKSGSNELIRGLAEKASLPAPVALFVAPQAEEEERWADACNAWSRAASQGTLEAEEPEFAGVLHYRAALAAARGDDLDREWQELALATDLLPYDYPAHRAYARACDRREDWAGAAHAYQRLAAVAACDLDRVSALRSAATRWSRLAPDDPEAARRADDAMLGCLHQVLGLDPNDRRTAFRLEKALAAAGDVEQLTALDRVIDEMSTDEDEAGSVYARVRIADRMLSAGSYEGAAAELVAARSAGGQSPVLGRLLDRALAYAQRFAERASLLREIVDAEGQWLAPEVGLERAARAAEDVLNYQLLVEAEAAATPDDSRQEAREQAVIDALESAYETWTVASELENGSAPARLALLNLAQRYAYRTGDISKMVSALAAGREAAPTPARAIQLALRESAILLGEDDEASVERAEECLANAREVEAGDMRVALARMLQSVASENWEDTAEILIETADARGEQTVADTMRFRAAYILLDRVGDAGRAVDVVTPMVERHPEFIAAQDLVRAAHRQLGGTAILDPSLTAGATAVDVRRDFGDGFAQLIREAELHEYRVGDPGKAVGLYHKALEMRPGDPIARLGFDRAARASGKVAELADLALSELKAVDPGDSGNKARAYEYLARVDDELRGDADSALFSYKAAVDAEPSYYAALRALERRYGARSDWSALFGTYGNLGATLGSSPEAAALAMERARVAGLSGQPSTVVMAEMRRAYELNPQLRRALFALESDAQRGEPSMELAEIEVAVADYFAEDDRARASFYTRAGDVFVELGSVEPAIDYYRTALEVREDCIPALVGWRHAALGRELWSDVATTALRQAELEDELADKSHLFHLAGVALMDKALEGERAVAILNQVLELVPTHDDAFARLRLLLDEQARNEDLIALLEGRIEVIDSAEIRLELHHAAANLYRNLFEDREHATEHLRSMLDIDPDHLGALADLSDIAWEQGDWADAAETFIQRARLVTDERIARNIFFRLGLIYADYLPDAKIAIRSFERVLKYDENDLEALARLADLYSDTGEWKQALGACERLIKRETKPNRKIDHLHRAARVYVDGFEDAAKAEQAIKIALDVDPTSEKALAAVIEFFEGIGDLRGLRVNLDRVAAAMRSRLHRNALDPVAYRILSQIFKRREDVGVRGSLATAYCAAEMSHMLGSTDESTKELVASARRFRPKLATLAGTDLDDYLYPRAVSPALRAIYRILGDRVAKAVGIDLRAYGVGRSNRLSASDPIVLALQDVANDLKVGPIEVYVSSEAPTVAVAEPTSPVSLVIGQQLIAPDKVQQLRFLAGRALKLCTAGLAVPARMTAREFGLLTAAIIRQFQPDFAVPGLDNAAIKEEANKHRKLVPNKLQAELANFAVGLAGAPFDYKNVWAAIADAGNRAGLLAGGSIAAALAPLLVIGGYPDIQSAGRDVAIVHLMHFAVSEEYTVMRATSGT